jgi:prevent-host-death family protein
MNKSSPSSDTWRAAEARNRFTDLVDAAMEGHPQFVRRRDGREVVVVSREYFETMRPTLKAYLLAEGFAEGAEDSFDRALREIRDEGSPFVNPGKADLAG